MAGITGRKVVAAYGQSNSWGAAALVTQKILIDSTEGLDDKPLMVDDEAFGQDWLGIGEIGDRGPIIQEIPATMRFEDLDVWIAAACGSPHAVSAVGSQGISTSLASWMHVIEMSPELSHQITLAADLVQYVKEVRTMRIRGFNFRVGDNGKMMINFAVVGDRTVYDSSINTNSDVADADPATVGNRMLRKNMRIRLSANSATALGSADEMAGPDGEGITQILWDSLRPVADADHVANQDIIIEPDDDGFPEFPMEWEYARMNTITANSYAFLFAEGAELKADILINGPFINSTERRSFLVEMPALQIYEFQAPVTGNQQVRPRVKFRMKSAATSPTGMAITDPFRIQLQNMNSETLM